MPSLRKPFKADFAPIFLNNNKAVEGLLKRNPHVILVDAFSHQLKELFIIENPIYAGEKKTEVFAMDKFKKFCTKKEKNFTHVYYSWNHSIVKTVKRNDYLKLKTNRNQDLITAEEQEKLSKCRIGVLGMSVGSNIAFMLTQAGIANEITISDFDNLDTTNLNRIIAGSHQIGLSKCVIVARHIYEDNPFAKVHVLPNGVYKKDIENLLKQKKLDLIIDEVDNIVVKIDLRILAQKYKVPVVMVTDNGEGVVLHVERYDLAHKKIFGKEKKYFESFLSSNLSRERVVELIISDIVGGVNKVDKRMHKSVGRVLKKELVSWPQLGSAALLAGVVATHIIKQIVLGYDKRLDIRGHISPSGVVYGTH